MSRKAEIEKMAADKTAEMLSTVQEGFKEAVKAVAAPSAEQELRKTLDRLSAEYKTGTVSIHKRFPGQSDFVLFTILDNYPLEQLADEGPDALCMREGGGGEYRVKVKVPGMKDGAYQLTGIKIGGPSLASPKSSNDRAALDSTMLPAGALPMGATGGNVSPFPTYPRPGKEVEQLVNLASQQTQELAKQAASGSDRVMAIMMQNQQQMMQFLPALLANINGGGNRSEAASQQAAELAEMRAELRRMKEEKERDEKMRLQEKEINDLKMQLNRVESKPVAAGPETWLLPLMSSMQAQQQSSMSLFLEMMKMGQDRQSVPEQMAQFMSTQVQTTQALLGSMAEMARSGMFGGDNEHPIRDAILRMLDQAAGVASTIIEAKASQPKQLAGPSEAPPPPPVDAVVTDAPMQGIPEAVPPQLEEHPAEAEGEGDEQEELNEAELAQFDRDNALLRVLACLHSNIHVSEATSRIFAHASSGNVVAIKWLENPHAVTYQVVAHHEMDEKLADSLSEDIVGFLKHVSENKDPNLWSKTSYKPLRQREDKDKTSDHSPSVPPPAAAAV